MGNGDQSILDQIRVALLKGKAQEQAVTIDDLIGISGLSHSQIYQGLYRMRGMNEVDIIKSERDGDKRPRIIGIKLLKMETPDKINGRIQETTVKKNANFEIKKMQHSTSIPNLLAYMNKKVAVEQARGVLLAAGVKDATISFEADPIGEEAINLLAKLEAKITEYADLEQRLRAAESNLRNLKEDAKTTEQVSNPVGANY